MLTDLAQLGFVCPGNWFGIINLKDAYFHIPILSPLTESFSDLPLSKPSCVCQMLGRSGRMDSVWQLRWLVAANVKAGRCRTKYLMMHLSSLGFQVNLTKTFI